MSGRSWWGWGLADRALDDEQTRALGERRVRPYLPLDGAVTPVPPVPSLPPPRLSPPAALASRCSAAPDDRAAHAYGKAYRDVARALTGRLDNPPDLVAHPTDEADVAAVLDWAGEAGFAVVPYGGGTSVDGGVEYRGDGPWLSLDLRGLDTVEVDEVNRVVAAGAGVLGPALEDRLRPAGLTLRHYPQSFEFSTVGGWVATRAGGHFATGPTHIDDLVQAVRVVTPVGVGETARVPASGAGPAPERLFLGSEGILGVISAAWLRVRPRPRVTAAATITFQGYGDSLAAVRAVARSGLQPANCRLLDPLEAALQVGATDGAARLLLGFEAAHGSQAMLDAALAEAVELCTDAGGALEPASERAGAGSAQRWRAAFLRAPYLRDALIRLGLIVETVETACAWDRFAGLHEAVAGAAVAASPTGAALVSYRFTHVYPDGPAPYFTIIAPAPRGAQVSGWDEIKSAVNDAIAAHGGAVTHHHAVGRDHRPWYDAERAGPFDAALRAAKAALDPRGVLNPGALIDP